MLTTLCLSCNAPAPQFDAYQELSAEILSVIASGVTIVRMTNEGTDLQKKGLPDRSSIWMDRAVAALHRGNDMRELFAEVNRTNPHAECDAWKITYRRLNGLLVELDYLRRGLIGVMYPKLLRS